MAPVVGIWMSGGSPAAEQGGNLYLSTGNGTFDASSSAIPNSDFGESVLKLSPSLSVADWFTPFNESSLEPGDRDLGSGGVVLLPDQASGPTHLLVTGGKEGKLYVLNRDRLGNFCTNCTSTDTNVIQSFAAAHAIFGTPAFWLNGLYLGGVADKLSLFAFDPSTGKFNSSPASQSRGTYSFPGAAPSISSQGATNGVVWAIDSSQYGAPKNAGGPAVLHAYDATNLASELWNSSQAPNNRDQAGNAVKFTVPTVANGKVYVGTQSTVEVYGLLPNSPASGPYSTNFPLAEDPVSEGGNWVGGNIAGLDWQNMFTTGGHVEGHMAASPTYNDATALLQTGTWSANQSAQGTVYNDGASGGCGQEVEIRLRSHLSANLSTGYEITFSTAGNEGYVLIVRWNGPVGDFTYLEQVYDSKYHVVDGDVISASIVGDTISAYKNGTLMIQAIDSTYMSGAPGMGVNSNSGCTHYGFKDFSASDSQ